MPTVLRLDGYRFFFYSDEGQEPPHVHVTRSGKSAKFWLDEVELARSAGYTVTEINETWHIVIDNRSFLKEKWDEFHRSLEEN